MVRIIPWSLPPVKGGSIGGYTPKVDPTPPTPEPEPPAQYYDFSNAAITGGEKSFAILFTSTSFAASEEKDVTSKVTGITDLTATFGGIQAIDLIGVTSLKVKVAFSNSILSGHAQSSTGSIVLSLDPVTYGISYGGIVELNVTNTVASTQTFYFGEVMKNKVDSLTFYVYNGNGEIIQTEEVTIE